MCKLKNKKNININNLTRSTKSLSQRVIRGGAWVFALRITERGFSIQIYDCDPKLYSHHLGVGRIARLAMTTPEIFLHTDLQEALIGKF